MTTFLIIIGLIVLGSASWPMFKRFRENRAREQRKPEKISLHELAVRARAWSVLSGALVYSVADGATLEIYRNETAKETQATD
jgi:hypothetical protein